MVRILSVAVLVAAASAMFALSLPQADGCAAVRHRDGPSIHIAEESAIIVWDPVKKVQHFIRRAAFDTNSPDFGFLVPTPAMPELPFKVVEDGIFAAIDTWLLPRTVEQSRIKSDPMFCISGCSAKRAAMDMAMKSEPKVLHEQKVGGYDVKVLQGDDAEALAKWIKDNGYSADPELYEWLKPYVAGNWKISAFKISQDPKTGQLATTKAVRMSFKTERPFFPYREPESKKSKDDKESDLNPRGGRLLRVLFVSDMRMDGKLGNAAWHATIPWSDSLTDEQRQRLVMETGVPGESVPTNAWLTTFEDRASPRPGKEEVFFDPAVEGTPIRPPDIIKYNDVWIPIDCSVFVMILIMLIGLSIIRARSKDPAWL